MSRFEDWNLLLLREYFQPGLGGEEVFFDTTEEKLDEIGPQLGGCAGLLQAVRQGPSWPCGSSLAERIDALVRQRSSGKSFRPAGYIDPGALDERYRSALAGTPTYLPYLAALVHAWAAHAQEEGGFYDTLQANLMLPQALTAPQKTRIFSAWEDLARWTQSAGGHFGRFVVRRLGEHPHVSLLRSQVVLSDRDVNLMCSVFRDLRLKPGAPLGDDEVKQAIASIPDQGASVGLRKAARDQAFGDFLGGIIRELALEWDGTASSVSRHDGEGEGTLVEPRLGLTLSDGKHLPWRIQLAIPAPLEDGRAAELLLHDRPIPIEPRNDLGAVCSLDAEAVTALHGSAPWAALIRASAAPMPVGDPRKRVWVLVGQTAPDGRWELWEHDLPAHGGAYLLADEAGAEGLHGYLLRTMPAYQEVPSDGLPNGWRLVFLELQALDDDQRALPDGKDAHPRPPAIRFERGVSVRKGRRRGYLAYDLPVVVLDAPHDATISCLMGGQPLALQEIDGEAQRRSEDAEPSAVPIGGGIRRFQLPPQVEEGGKFDLVAMQGGIEHGRATLRVWPSGEDDQAGWHPGSLDPEGRFQRNDIGLRGGLAPASWGPESASAPIGVDASELGPTCTNGWEASSVGALLLDALAGAGSMSYGRIRELARRLLKRQHARSSPHYVIDLLWSRGHLEVQRNERGHWIRVHSVRPAVYRLAAECNGQPVYGVLGTLTLRQWRELLECAGPADGWSMHIDRMDTLLPALRLLCHGGTLDRVREAGFEALPFQGGAIAQWSANTQRMLATLAGSRTESATRHPRDLREFVPAYGNFLNRRQLSRPVSGKGPSLSVFQMQDRRSEKLRMHLIAQTEGFSFAWDERWAVWLALESFCEYLASVDARFDDLAQWPIPHDPTRGDVWLPACLRLPPVLERAAVLCHGGGPQRYNMLREVDGDACVLRLKSSGAEVLRVHGVYAEMASGTWLRYRWVPGEVLRSIQN